MTRTGNGGDDISAEIEQVTAAIARTEAAGAPLPDRIAAMNAAFDDDLTYFRERGFAATGYRPGEREFYQMKALRGALVATSGAVLRKIEQTRIERAFEAAGGFGIDEATRQDRLIKLRAKLRQLQAQREIAWREKEAAGETIERTGFDPEAFLRLDQDLQAIASGQEAAA